MNHKTILSATHNLTIPKLAEHLHRDAKTKTPLFLIKNKYYAVTRDKPNELGLNWHVYENQAHGTPSKIIWVSDEVL